MQSQWLAVKYTIGDKELLSIGMVLTESHTMLMGDERHICTNHLNITTIDTSPDHVIWWINYVEQYNPYIHFIHCKDNVIAGPVWDLLDATLVHTQEEQILSTQMLTKVHDFCWYNW